MPTELQRRGDFSQTFDARGNLIAIYDPPTPAGTPRRPFAGNVIPADRLDPVGLRLAALYPLPNRPAENVTGANNFGANGTTRLERDNYMVKIEHTVGSNDKITGRYLYNSDNMFQTSVFAPGWTAGRPRPTTPMWASIRTSTIAPPTTDPPATTSGIA